MTLVCYGFSAYEIDQIIRKDYPLSDLFIITDPLNSNLDQIIKSSKKTKKTILFDNSSSKKINIFII